MHILLITISVMTIILFGVLSYTHSRRENNKYPILLGISSALFPPVLISVLSSRGSSDSNCGKNLYSTIIKRVIIVIPIIALIIFAGDALKNKLPMLGNLYAYSYKLFTKDISIFINQNVIEFGDYTIVLSGSAPVFGGLISIALILSAFYIYNWPKYICILTSLSILLALISDWFRNIKIISETVYLSSQGVDPTHFSSLGLNPDKFIIFKLSVCFLLYFSAYIAYRSYNHPVVKAREASEL